MAQNFTIPCKTDNRIFSFLSEIFKDILLMILFQDSTILVANVFDKKQKESFSESTAFPHFPEVFRFS